MALTQKGQTGLVKQAAEPLVLLHASSPPWHAVTQPLINLYQHKDIQATKNWTYCGYSLSQNYFFFSLPYWTFLTYLLSRGVFWFWPLLTLKPGECWLVVCSCHCAICWPSLLQNTLSKIFMRVLWWHLCVEVNRFCIGLYGVRP